MDKHFVEALVYLWRHRQGQFHDERVKIMLTRGMSCDVKLFFMKVWVQSDDTPRKIKFLGSYHKAKLPEGYTGFLDSKFEDWMSYHQPAKGRVADAVNESWLKKFVRSWKVRLWRR